VRPAWRALLGEQPVTRLSAANVLMLGDVVNGLECSSAMPRRIEATGLTMVTVLLDETHEAGGSVHCLTFPLSAPREGRRAVA
jgi:N-dimethylarginine dimethylaminohydrolase